MAAERTHYSLIVIVEDDQAIREVLKMAIELEGYKVQAVQNGEEAMALLKNLDKACLILTDLMMPVMNGYEFIKLASQTHTIASIPIVVLSASEDENRINRLSETGSVKGLVKKPVDLHYLMGIVHKYCGPPPIAK